MMVREASGIKEWAEALRAPSSGPVLVGLGRSVHGRCM